MIRPCSGSNSSMGMNGVRPNVRFCVRPLTGTGLKTGKVSNIFVSMKPISKRQLQRKPSLVSKLKPGETLMVEDVDGSLVISRGKRSKLSADDMHRELDRLCDGAPKLDTQAVLDDLRQ
jgi:hypothetical protein